MKLLNIPIFGTILFFVSAIFSACDSYEDGAPRVDNDNSYFYFPSTELTSSERAEYEAIKKEYQDNIGNWEYTNLTPNKILNKL